MLRSSFASGRPIHRRRLASGPPVLFADPVAPPPGLARRRSSGLAVVVLTVSATMALLASPVASQVPPPPSTAAAGPPVVSYVFWNFGPAAGNDGVFINGSALSGATSVTFGGQPALAFTVHSDTLITAIVPPAATPPAPELVVDVAVTTPSGTNAPTPGAQYHYWARPVITAVTPDPVLSSVEGNQVVTLTVANVGPGGPRSVRVDGLAVSWWYVDGRPDLIRLTTPSHVPGPAELVVESRGGTSEPVAITYVDTPLPVVTSVAPDHGSIDGGTTVVLTGAHLTGATQVWFGEPLLAASFTVDSDTQITLVTPAAPSFGTYAVTVATPVGRSQPWLGGADFHFDGPPAIDGIAPAHGPTAGGTHITLWGRDFHRVTQVWFGDVAATSWTLGEWGDSIEAAVPPHTAGTVTVTVDSDLGRSREAILFDYTDAGVPIVDALEPNHGPIAGGTTLTIRGSGFATATAVTIGWGGTPMTFTVDSPTQITATTPAWGWPETVPVNVTNGAGTSDSTQRSYFTYDSPPVVWGLDPASGPPAGGTATAIAGDNLAGATAVRFDGVAVPFTWNPERFALEVVTPPHAPGRVVVVVEGPSGVSDATPGWYNTFLYNTPGVPVVREIWPPEGSELGGTEVFIDGDDLANVTGVRFGSTPATSFEIRDEGALRVVAISPPHAPGPVDIILESAAGNSVPLAVAPFTYLAQPPPDLYAVSPPDGPVEGGSNVHLWGSGFLGTTAVTFGGRAATFTVVDDYHIIATVPAAADQANDAEVAVVVTTPLGIAASDSVDDHYTYRAESTPVIQVVSPNRGGIAGGEVVAIHGTGLSGATSVRFGTREADFTVVSDREIHATSPAVDEPYLYDVTVTTPRGVTESTPASWYLYRSEPVVWGIEANTGSVLGGETVTITGDQFLDTWSVMFGWNGANYRVVDQHTIIATVPACAAGTVAVTVNTPAGASAVTLGSLYTYRDPGTPVVTKTDANRGSTAGGETVVLTGSGFTGATGVRFEDTPATSYTVESDTRITAVAPAHASPGLVNIAVESPSGSNPNAPTSWYLYESP